MEIDSDNCGDWLYSVRTCMAVVVPRIDLDLSVSDESKSSLETIGSNDVIVI